MELRIEARSEGPTVFGVPGQDMSRQSPISNILLMYRPCVRREVDGNMATSSLQNGLHASLHRHDVRSQTLECLTPRSPFAPAVGGEVIYEAELREERCSCLGPKRFGRRVV